MTTTIGQQIIDLLAMTHSVARLVEFLRDREYFNECVSIDYLKPGYIYSIQINKWKHVTGIDPETLSTRWADTDVLPPTDDGLIWVDHYFELNTDGHGYQEDEGPRDEDRQSSRRLEGPALLSPGRVPTPPYLYVR